MCISHSELLIELQVDDVESGKIADTISDVSQAYICDFITSNKESWDTHLTHSYS